MANINLWAAWIGILLGLASGTLQGLCFHRDNWLGGYGSWPRRLMRPRAKRRKYNRDHPPR